ncbi:MAG: helix-turn-helix transcriptional regulator [Ruminiclostridium sp.]|nr:helix-turn-helix transcriptional regulator [Ruminiclostridium sp.]
MEFNEKLQELRKSRGLTQEELAKELYVSRTAVSKWESGKGYPGIDSLKELSRFFSVSIDSLLSSEKLIYIADKENKSNIKGICNLLSGFADTMALMLIFLPLYPKPVNDFIYSVNLIAYTDISKINQILYWTTFISLALIGVIRIILNQIKAEKGQKLTAFISIVVNVLMIFVLALARESYAVITAFLILLIKGLLIIYERKRNGII